MRAHGLAGLLALSMAPAAWAATITIQIGDEPGEGFNDATPVAPLPDNPGTTLGAQRLNLFNYAAARWGERIQSSVTIIVKAQFPIDSDGAGSDTGFTTADCNASSGKLGNAGTNFIYRDFTGAVPNTWYTAALANALAGSDLNTSQHDINANFNPFVDSDPNCLGGDGFYYGTDGNAGSKVDLLATLMHELGHGLGFASFTNGSTGAPNDGRFGIYERFLFDENTDTFWTAMDNAGRAASAISNGNLVWNGTNVNRGAATFTAGLNNGRARMYDPAAFAGGSSVSHFNTAAAPNLLMEPFITSGLMAGGAKVDMTSCLFADLGWTLIAPYGCPDYLSDLAISVVDSVDPFTVGGTFNYDVVVTNNGPAQSNNVTVSTSASGAAATVFAVSSTQGNCSAMPCNLGTIPGGGSATVTLATSADEAGTAVRNVAVVADQTDLFPLNDSASDTTTIAAGAGDTSPNPFTFSDPTNQPTGIVKNSELRTISGIDGATPVSITGGLWQKNSTGGYVSTSGTVLAGDTIQLRHTTAATANTAVTTTITVGDYSESFTTTTGASDTTPASFSFTDLANQPTGVQRTSEARTITGINAAAAVTVTNGTWRKNQTGSFVGTAGTVVSGDKVEVRQITSGAANTSLSTTLKVGSFSEAFTTTTGATDTTPDAFNFQDLLNQPTGVVRDSEIRTISGLSGSVSVSISGPGTYRINETGAYRTTQATVANGDTVRVRQTTSPDVTTTQTATLTVGNFSEAFSTTTGTADKSPTPFGFTDLTGQATGIERISNTITISGMNQSAPVSVSGPGGSYRKNGTGGFVTAAGTAVNGDTFEVRHVSSSQANTKVTTTLTVGTFAEGFSTTTGAADTTPAAFSLGAQSNVPKSSLRTSASVQINGINTATPISVANGAYQIDGVGAFVTTAGTINAGQKVKVQHTSSANGSTATQTVLTVGGVSGTFTTTTVP